VIEVLKAMLVCLVNSKTWSFCLQVEVNKAFRPWLDHGLVIGTHCAELEWIETVLVPCRLPVGSVTFRLEGNETFVDAFYVFLVRLRKVLLVVPHAIQCHRAAFRR